MFETVLCYTVQFTINNSELSYSFQRCILAQPPSKEEEVEEQVSVETTERKKSKLDIGPIVGSLSTCLGVIIVASIVLR